MINRAQAAFIGSALVQCATGVACSIITLGTIIMVAKAPSPNKGKGKGKKKRRVELTAHEFWSPNAYSEDLATAVPGLHMPADEGHLHIFTDGGFGRYQMDNLATWAFVVNGGDIPAQYGPVTRDPSTQTWGALKASSYTAEMTAVLQALAYVQNTQR